MPNPIDAPTMLYHPDPCDEVAYIADIGRGSGPNAILDPDERVVSFTLAPSATGVAAGLIIMEGNGRDTVLVDPDPALPPALGFWLCVDPSLWAHPMFNGRGFDAGLECTVVTDTAPQATKQFTLLVNIRNN